MPTDSFPPWVAKVRKDPLGAVGYSSLIDRAKWAERQFLAEHLATNVGGGAGEHNAAEVPREVGAIYVSGGGPVFDLEGFRHATGVANPATGTFEVALDSNVYPSVDAMTVQIQNTSENGINKPCLSSFTINSSSEIVVYQKKLFSALGAGNVWAAEDTTFSMAIHGAPIGVGVPGTPGIRKQRGDELSSTVTDINQQIQFDADLREKFLLDHNASGQHINCEVGQTWAHVEVDSGGGAYSIVATGTRNPLTVTRLSLGVVRLTNTTPWVLPAQPFVTTDYQRANGGAEEDTYNSPCPRSLVTTTTFDVFLYKYDFIANTWARADTDFFVVVHAGY